MRAVARSILRDAITRSLTSPGVGGEAFTPNAAYFAGRPGAAYDAFLKDALYTDAARTTPVAIATDLIGSLSDGSGNGHHQAQAGSIRPSWNNSRAEFAILDYLESTGFDFTGTDTVTVIASIYKANDTNVTAICELGNVNSEAGFTLRAPANGTGGFYFASRGSALAAVSTAPADVAPVTAVLTGIGRISTDTCILRVNGTFAKSSIADQGTGNYGNHSLFLGSSLGSTLKQGCNIYRLAVLGWEPSEAELNNLEKWAAEPAAITIGPAKFTMVALGDSLTYAVNGSVTANQAYVKQLDSRLARVVHSVNEGYSGDTTCRMMARRWQMIRQATPNIAIIYAGTNDVNTSDTVKASPTPTSTTFALNAFAAAYAADGWITVGGESAQILSIVGNLVTLKAPLAGGAPAAGTAVVMDTQKNLTELVTYVKNAGCERVMVLGMHYFNFSTGADTTSVQLARNATLRTKQQAAAAAAGAVYVDLYAWMSALITAGTYTQGDNLWHSAVNDQHLSLAGQTILADAIEAAIIAQGWT